jgi:hypothetical protein
MTALRESGGAGDCARLEVATSSDAVTSPHTTVADAVFIDSPQESSTTVDELV